ncbi:hypothetical protein [Metabacillus fastidiosus]|uniref:hypothetical protein n=1 Tax=Metabacillus fastidiosus TaxID=1458 RepID=UPI003D26AC16
MSYGSPVLDYCYDIPPEEQETRIEMNKDLGIIDVENLFIHGCIEISVIDGDGLFIYLGGLGFIKRIKLLIIGKRKEENKN